MNNKGFTLVELCIGVPVICLMVFLFGMSVYGAYLAFSASILLGVVVLIVEPGPLIIGAAKIFWDVDLAQKFVEWIQNL